MNTRKIAWESLKRRKAKAAYVFVGLMTGAASVAAFAILVQAMGRDINHKLEMYGANILIVPKTENLSLSYGGLTLGGVSFGMRELSEDDLKKVDQIKNRANIAAVGPMVLGAVKVNEQDVLLAGMDFEKAGFLRPWWVVAGGRPKGGEILAGAEAAKTLGLAPGDTLRIRDREFPVSGVLEPTGSQDDQILFAPLAVAQEVLGKIGVVSMAEVAALCSACPIDDMVDQIGGKLGNARVMAIRQVVEGRMQALGHFRKAAYALSALVILAGALVVFVTMMGNVRERAGEFGIFRAIGFKKRHVVGIVFLEAAVVSGLAGVAGYLAGYGAALVSAPHFMEAKNAAVAFSPGLLAGVAGLALILGVTASAYPALMASRQDPNRALRSL